MLKQKKKAVISLESIVIISSWVIVFLLIQRGSMFGSCYAKMDTRIVHWEKKLVDFKTRTPNIITTKNLQLFRESRTTWHREFKKLVVSVETEFHDDDIGEVCLHSVLYIYLASNLFAIAFFAFIFVYFVYQETRTPYGASRKQISFAAFGFTWSFGILFCLNYGFFRILKNMVSISNKFASCLTRLKKLQVALIDDDLLNFDSLDLRATLWDGYRFGFRDPIFNAHLDSKQFNVFLYYVIGIIITISIFLILLWYRSRRQRIFRWRLGIESTVCIGILLPEQNIVARCGSGCLVKDVSGQLGVLTNWHLFRQYVTARSDEEMEYYKNQHANNDLLKHRRNFSDGAHLSYSLLNDASKKIVIGTARDSLHGRPRWQFIAENPDISRSSPASEYTPNGNGLDLVYLNLSNFVRFHGMREQDSTKMAYDNLTIENKDEPANVQRASFKKKLYKWRLNGFAFGRTENLEKGYHKLRLLGYPGVGGHGLSVITDYFTGHRQDNSGGSWLLTAQPMPNGCSGGAVVNPEGELVGVATQTKGELSHIRSIVDASSVLGYSGDVDDLGYGNNNNKGKITSSLSSFNSKISNNNNNLKPPRLKRQLTPRSKERKESLPTHDVKSHNNMNVFNRFLENYQLTGRASSIGHIDEAIIIADDEDEIGILPGGHFSTEKKTILSSFLSFIFNFKNQKNTKDQGNICIKKKKL